MKAPSVSRAACVLLLGAPLPAVVPAAAAAAPVVEEIVVTGELRETRLADSPASISVLDLVDQRSGAVQHLEQVLGWAPNVNLASGGARARFVQMRGIGERGQFAEPLNPSVGLVVDGVDMSGVGTTATLFDVAQVEVLRGPQGTIYGANALAGLINIRSNDPSDTFEARAQLDAGDHGASGAGVVVSGPATDTLGYRLAVQRYRDDGFMKNRYLGRDDTDDHDELTLRGKLAWTPREDQRWLFTAGYVDADNGYDAYSLDNDRNTLSDEPGWDAQEMLYGSAQVRWDLSEAAAFQGTLALARSDNDYGYDEDWTFDGFHPDGYASTDRYRRERDSASVDLRWLSGPGGRLFGDTTDWVVGFYGLHQSVDMQRSYTYLASDLVSEFEVRRLAVYGELEHELDARTRVIVGLRAERHESDYDDSEQVRFDPRDDLLGGRLVLERDVGVSGMAYASATRGYKAGGFNISGTLEPGLREYDPEFLWNFEAGYKGSWLDDRLNARVALFTMQRDDVQVDTSITLVRPDGSAEFIDLIGNAAEGTNDGMELELTYEPVAALTLFASLGLLDTEFENYTNAAGEDLDGAEQAHAPSYQFHAGAEYRFARGWYLRVESEGKDGYYFSNSPRRFAAPGEPVANPGDLRADDYTLWHASVGYDAERWSIKLWGRNLGDEDHPVRGYYFGNDPRDGYTERGFYQLGEPRRMGVTLTVDY